MADFQLLNPLRWKKSFLIGLLAGFLVLWFGFLDTYSVYTRFQLNKEKSELKQEIELLMQETRVLESQIKELETNSFQFERIAREEYGMKKPGEVIYEIKDRN